MISSFFRWSLVVVCYASLGSTSVHADDPLATPTKAAARQHLVQGNRLYRTREFAKAVDEYKAGVLIQDAPVFYYNLGQCHRQLGNHQEALWYYEHFLNRGKPTGELREYVETFIAQMKAERDKAVTQPAIEPALESRQSRAVRRQSQPSRFLHPSPFRIHGIGIASASRSPQPELSWPASPARCF